MRKKWLTGILTGILLLNSTMMTEASPYVNRYLGGSYEVLAVDGTKAATSDLLTGQTEIQNIKDMKGIDAIVNDADNIYTYPEYVEDLLLLEEKYAQYLKIKSLTKTIDGREVWQITLGDVNAKNHILVDGAIHGREYHNSLLIMEQLEFFLENYDKASYNGKSYGELLSNTCIHFVPMVNPDGVSISQFGEAGIQSPEVLNLVRGSYPNYLYQGLTRAEYGRYLQRWKANARGVDLNRNFGAGFGGGEEYSIVPGSMYYCGVAPFSEPESMALATIVQTYNPIMVINYHSSGNIFYWSTYGNPSPGFNSFFADHISNITGYRKQGTFAPNGGFLEWIELRGNQIWALTLETGIGECPLPPQSYPQIWEQNYLMIPILLNYYKAMST